MILKRIRIAQVKRVPYPVILLLTTLWLSSFLPWQAFWFPQKFDSGLPAVPDTQANAFYTTMPEQLYYTGCDALTNGRVTGHYYYSMTRRRCQIYLLPKQNGTPPAMLSHALLKGRLLEQQELLYQIADSMADSLEWSQRKILERTNPYILDTTFGTDHLHRLLYCLLPASLLLSVAGLAYFLFYALLPSLHPALRRARRETGRSHIRETLEQELSGALVKQVRSLYLTEHYLINLCDGNFIFQPLETVCWIYIHTSFSGLIRRHYRGTFYFTWWTRAGKSFEVPLPYKDDGITLMEQIQARHPDVLLRYSQYNKKEVEKILKKRIFSV